MAFVTSVDWPGVTKEIVISRASMPITQASPEIRRLDTDVLWDELKDLEKSADGILWPNIQRNNPAYTITGINFNQGWLIVPPYFLTFEDGQYRVALVNTNNNIIEIATQNQVGFVVNLSAGLQTVVSGSGVTQQDKDDIENQIFSRLIDSGWTFEMIMKQLQAEGCGDIEQMENGDYIVKNPAGTKDRMTGSKAPHGGRVITGWDHSS